MPPVPLAIAYSDPVVRARGHAAVVVPDQRRGTARTATPRRRSRRSRRRGTGSRCRRCRRPRTRSAAGRTCMKAPIIVFSRPSRSETQPSPSFPKPLAIEMPAAAAVPAAAAKPKLSAYLTIRLIPANPAPEIRMKETINSHICHVFSASKRVNSCSVGRLAPLLLRHPTGRGPVLGRILQDPRRQQRADDDDCRHDVDDREEGVLRRGLRDAPDPEDERDRAPRERARDDAHHHASAVSGTTCCRS